MNFRPASSSINEPRIELAPLIDVIFLLLLFFLLTTTFVNHQILDVMLPKAASTQPVATTDDLSVFLGADGRIVLQGEEIDPSTLTDALERAAERSPDGALLLYADQDVSHGHVVMVMDMAHKVGLQRISIVTESVTRHKPRHIPTD